MQRMAWGVGTVPEQIWEDPDVPASRYGANPRTASIGFLNGEAAGFADPLIWAQAQYVRLIRDLQARRLLDQPPVTRARYITHGAPARVPLAFRVSAPGAVTTPGHVSTAPPGIKEDILSSQESRTKTSRSHASVKGTTAPGAVVEIAIGQPGSPADTTSVMQAIAGADGTFRVTIPTPRGHAIVTVAAIAGSHATGWAQQTLSHR